MAVRLSSWCQISRSLGSVYHAQHRAALWLICACTRSHTHGCTVEQWRKPCHRWHRLRATVAAAPRAAARRRGAGPQPKPPGQLFQLSVRIRRQHHIAVWSDSHLSSSPARPNFPATLHSSALEGDIMPPFDTEEPAAVNTTPSAPCMAAGDAATSLPPSLALQLRAHHGLIWLRADTGRRGGCCAWLDNSSSQCHIRPARLYMVSAPHYSGQHLAGACVWLLRWLCHMFAANRGQSGIQLRKLLVPAVLWTPSSLCAGAQWHRHPSRSHLRHSSSTGALRVLAGARCGQACTICPRRLRTRWAPRSCRQPERGTSPWAKGCMMRNSCWGCRPTCRSCRRSAALRQTLRGELTEVTDIIQHTTYGTPCSLMLGQVAVMKSADFHLVVRRDG